MLRVKKKKTYKVIFNLSRRLRYYCLEINNNRHKKFLSTFEGYSVYKTCLPMLFYAFPRFLIILSFLFLVTLFF